jgi:hypothetical protein
LIWRGVPRPDRLDAHSGSAACVITRPDTMLPATWSQGERTGRDVSPLVRSLIHFRDVIVETWARAENGRFLPIRGAGRGVVSLPAQNNGEGGRYRETRTLPPACL